MAGLADRAPLPNLAGCAWLTDPALLAVVEALEPAGEVRAVGGAVRDTLLGRAVKDADFATPILPERVTELARAAGLKVVPTGLEHGTVTVISDGRPFEVTTLRRDVSTDGRRAVVAFTTDWAEDASRRDFTMNAIYAAPDGRLFDPVAGYADLRARHVRFIGRAAERIAEDYLRVLRFFRLHAEIGRGTLDPEGLAACRSLAKGLAGLSGERVRGELLRLLAAPGAEAALRAMAEGGILAALNLAPANLERFGRLARIEEALRRAPDGLLRLAAVAPARVHPDVLAEALRLSRAERGRLEGFRAGGDIAPDMAEAERDRLHVRLGDAGFVDAVLLAWAAAGADADDAAWRGLAELPKRRPAPDFPLRGTDLLRLGYAAGPAMGAELDRLKEIWIGQGFRPGRKELLALARRTTAGG